MGWVRDLNSSPVVANNAMNRGRRLKSYAAELRFDVVSFLQGNPSWLDLCCGQGRALHDVAQALPDAYLEGLDLVDYFDPEVSCRVRRRVGSVDTYQPNRRFGLITCVHGLHYVGDKLGLLERALGWLEPEGVLLAHLDCNNLWLGSRPARPAFFRKHGLDYHTRFRLLSSRGRQLQFGWHYLGADDQAGANYTGQPAVNSHYQVPQS